MDSLQPTTRPPRTVLWLQFCGFDSAQIARLVELRHRCSRERDELSREELNRLGFVRWMYQRGLINEGNRRQG